jgi:transcriptional regulator with XRE-family HTH domain
LPFSTLDATVSRLPKNYTKTPKTIGEHLLKLRVDLKLTQKAVAEKIGVSQSTVGQWEKDNATPEISHMKNVIDFIGYYPLEEPNTLAERIQKYRYIHGLSLEEFGALVDADGATVWTWENERYEPLYITRKKIEGLVNNI